MSRTILSASSQASASCRIQRGARGPRVAAPRATPGLHAAGRSASRSGRIRLSLRAVRRRLQPERPYHRREPTCSTRAAVGARLRRSVSRRPANLCAPSTQRFLGGYGSGYGYITDPFGYISQPYTPADDSDPRDTAGTGYLRLDVSPKRRGSTWMVSIGS